MRSIFLWALFFAGLAGSFCFAEPVQTEHVIVELSLENQTLQPGASGAEANWIGLRLEMSPKWHTYWRYPGDTGLATNLKWKLPSGWSVSEPAWQLPERILLPPLVNFGYEGEALIGYQLKVPANEPEGERTLQASASWLVCKEECIPEKADLSVRVRVSRAKPKPNPWSGLFVKLRAQSPKEGALHPRILHRGQELGLQLPASDGVQAGDKLDFFPLEGGVIKGDSAPKVETGREGTVLWMAMARPFRAGAEALAGLLVVTKPAGEAVYSVRAALPAGLAAEAPKEGEAVLPAAQENVSNWMAVAMAFLGGLVLNLMPCVFPVLGIKVMSLVKSGTGGVSNRQQHHHARLHGKVYGLGVLVSFWVLALALLALRTAGQAAGWGFQLQQPRFVTVLIFLFSFIAADLAGFVRWGGRWMGAGANLANREGYAGSFFTGMLAVVVATPCTAPFMGTAIGAAFNQPAWVVLLVFSALGLGLALPFVFLCYQPGFLSILPRPGAWMERLKQFFAFPMVATVLWLLWVLNQQVGADGTLKVELGLLLVMIAVWLRYQFAQGPAWILGWLLLALGANMAGSVTSAVKAVAGEQGAWKAYSEGALEEALKSGKPVFVDFTAAWCLTCQINKKLVLESASTQDYLSSRGVVLLLADWTSHDPAITKALERQGRIGVPLYLAYRAGSREPVILPQVLSESALREAFP